MHFITKLEGANDSVFNHSNVIKSKVGGSFTRTVKKTFKLKSGDSDESAILDPKFYTNVEENEDFY